jgi:uncharacterized 2Fe-2S/4Fe-4S cluster protein (DUF4445 family)
VNANQRKVAQRAARAVEYVETAVEPRFQEHFVGAMGLPHGSEPFPHLEGIIPETSASDERSTRRRSRRSRRSQD